jgi:glycosyltransferase involved in cell wall biosynthesis
MLARRVVCVSEDSRQVAEREGIPSRKLMTIVNGIDSRRFDYTGPKPGGPAVMVARMVAAKGGDILLRAVQQVLRTRPDFRLVMAGDGDALPSLIGLARELGVEHAVQFLGEVRDIPALLAQASMFILSSLSEGVSLTVLEAMARGLPVVTTRVGGNPEVVDDPTTGLLVPPSDSCELAAAILKVWSNPELGERMGRAGRERVEHTFEVRQMTRQYEDLYRRLSSEAKYGARPRREPARAGV